MPAILNTLSILFINYIYRMNLTTQKYFYRSFQFATWLSNLHV